MNKLACLMRDRGMSQKDLGFAVGVSRISMNRYVRGVVRPSNETLGKIATVLEWEGNPGALLEKVDLGEE